MTTPPPHRRREISREELRGELDAFERRYGVPSERMVEVFRTTGGDLDETEDFHRWQQLHAAWQAETAPQA
ncbi:hypothetical protein ER308_15160 [Egibacter rhizosphaerae]|uniref:Uncharacterized protein n=1 Tax=Egibacter rhizosphaerae TaxID=1670831 RepID=A0A411YHQ1_9ACTN|nr:hypothetical protein [Egibacter rhizosphaerae]QBI20770.1 hypothetical protein ER308_15160 [Egibacter rhizosphaerae]